VRLAALIAGILFTLWTFWAMVRAMLVPHGTVNVVARSVQWGVGAMARVPLRLMSSYSMRDRWLAGVAVYATILIFTLGLIVFGLTDLTLGDSLYQSGSTFTTLGIVEPVNVPSAITTFIAAFLGLIVIAIFVGYLMGTYSAYVGRESQMARIAMVAGEPAWGPQILIRGRSRCESLDRLDHESAHEPVRQRCPRRLPLDLDLAALDDDAARRARCCSAPARPRSQGRSSASRRTRHPGGGVAERALHERARCQSNPQLDDRV
jgi:hypothetical protein